MANKQFGVKEFTLIGSSGSPTIQSPNNINLNANTVAISTDVTIGNNLTVTNNLVSNNITVSNLSINNVAGVTTIVNLNATTVNVSGVSTFAGITTVTGRTLFSKQLNVSGVSTIGDVLYAANGVVLGTTENSNEGLVLGGPSQTGQLYYNSVSSRNEFSGANTDFYIRAKNYTFATGSSGPPAETAITITQDGSVSLYHDNSKKFETLGAGVTVTGTTFTNQLSVSGVSTFGNLNVNNSTTELSSIVNIRKAAGGNLTAGFSIGGQATLYYDGTQRLQTSSVGVVVNGDFTVQANGNVSAGSLTLGSVSGATGNLNVSGVTTSVGGFTSGVGTAVKITTVGNQLVFTVPGVGTTSLTLY